jgi:hypothetical protein
MKAKVMGAWKGLKRWAGITHVSGTQCRMKKETSRAEAIQRRPSLTVTSPGQRRSEPPPGSNTGGYALKSVESTGVGEGAGREQRSSSGSMDTKRAIARCARS